MELPLLSIIIPVYNTEEYLTDCLNSLVSQMKQRVEIILIDDSSVDKSWSICKKYEKKYDYILFFSKDILDYLLHEILEFSMQKGIILAL